MAVVSLASQKENIKYKTVLLSNSILFTLSFTKIRQSKTIILMSVFESGNRQIQSDQKVMQHILKY
jgi:hypothetical protein